MKFRDFKRFSGNVLQEVISWISNDLNSVMRELFIGLNNIRFTDNFKSFQWEGEFAVSETKQIVHSLGKTPTGYIIYKQIGDGVIDASTSEWTNEVVYLRNNSASNTIKVTVIFFL